MAILEFERQSFGENLRTLRLARRMTQREMAAQAGLSLPYISDIETGRTIPSLEAIEKIASAFGARLRFSFVYDIAPPELVAIPRKKINQIRDILDKYDNENGHS